MRRRAGSAPDGSVMLVDDPGSTLHLPRASGPGRNRRDAKTWCPAWLKAGLEAWRLRITGRPACRPAGIAGAGDAGISGSSCDFGNGTNGSASLTMRSAALSSIGTWLDWMMRALHAAVAAHRDADHHQVADAAAARLSGN